MLSHNNVLEIESGKCASQANFLADGTFNSEEKEKEEEKTPAIIFFAGQIENQAFGGW